MSDVKLGILPEGLQHRDAIHIAIAPVTSDEPLQPGQHVALVDGFTDKVKAAGNAVGVISPFVGIVDPFLKEVVRSGSQFWLLLYPQTVTGMRHEWQHPAFVAPQPTPVEASKAWLEVVANDCGVSYERMIDAISEDDYINMGDNEHYKSVLSKANKDGAFKHHCEVVLGKTLSDTPYPFSCAC